MSLPNERRIQALEDWSNKAEARIGELESYTHRTNARLEDLEDVAHTDSDTPTPPTVAPEPELEPMPETSIMPLPPTEPTPDPEPPVHTGPEPEVLLAHEFRGSDPMWVTEQNVPEPWNFTIQQHTARVGLNSEGLFCSVAPVQGDDSQMKASIGHNGLHIGRGDIVRLHGRFRLDHPGGEQVGIMKLQSNLHDGTPGVRVKVQHDGIKINPDKLGKWSQQVMPTEFLPFLEDMNIYDGEEHDIVATFWLPPSGDIGLFRVHVDGKDLTDAGTQNLVHLWADRDGVDLDHYTSVQFGICERVPTATKYQLRVVTAGVSRTVS